MADSREACTDGRGDAARAGKISPRPKNGWNFHRDSEDHKYAKKKFPVRLTHVSTAMTTGPEIDFDAEMPAAAKALAEKYGDAEVHRSAILRF